MIAAALAGIGWGALHALSGPDHLLALAPDSVARPRGAWRLGAWWGAGHAAGTAAWAILIALAAAAIDLDRFAGHLDRLAGVALVVTGVIGWRRGRALRTAPRAAGAAPRGSTFLVGALHGLTGAASLLFVLPVLAGAGATRWSWLSGFGLGSTLAMSLLTAALGAGARSLAGPLLRAAAPVASAGAIALGVAWALG
jgi:hypothetical protein